LRIGFEIRKKVKNIKVKEFVKKIKEIYEVKVILKKLQEKMKRYIKRRQ